MNTDQASGSLSHLVTLKQRHGIKTMSTENMNWMAWVRYPWAVDNLILGNTFSNPETQASLLF